MSVSEATVSLTKGTMSKADYLAYLKSANLTDGEIITLACNGSITAEEATDIVNAKKSKRLFLKTGKKGGASLYGLQRMPITLYREGWNSLLQFADQIRAYLAENKPCELDVADIIKGAKTDKAQDEERAFLLEVAAGKHPHAKLAEPKFGPDGKLTGGKLTVTLSNKSE
jgi:hypothetical protein